MIAGRKVIPVKVLFVCSANRFRSVIASACFKDLVEKKKPDGNWEVSSAGTWAIEGLPPLSQAISIAAKLGLNIDQVRSREVDANLLQDADLVIVMSNGQKEALTLDFPQEKDRIFLCSEVCENQAYSIPDPVEDVIDQTPEELGEEICRLVNKGFDEICELAVNLHKKGFPER
jgi:protein-tyrosine phosphatase